MVFVGGVCLTENDTGCRGIGFVGSEVIVRRGRALLDGEMRNQKTPSVCGDADTSPGGPGEEKDDV